MSLFIQHARNGARPKGAVTLIVDGDPRNVVCQSCVVADTAVSRMRGLLGRSELPSGEGLLLRPAPSIHTAFMRFPIDAVFLNRELQVVGIRSGLRPWRAASCRGAKAALELPAGEVERRGIRVGDRLVVVETPPAIDEDLSSLVERVGAMLADDAREQPSWHEIEALLTEGYAQTLALEGERWRIERLLSERPVSRWRKRKAERRSLTARHDKVDRDVQWLRAVLAELYHYGAGLRDAVKSQKPARPSSRAA